MEDLDNMDLDQGSNLTDAPAGMRIISDDEDEEDIEGLVKEASVIEDEDEVADGKIKGTEDLENVTDDDLIKILDDDEDEFEEDEE